MLVSLFQEKLAMYDDVKFGEDIRAGKVNGNEVIWFGFRSIVVKTWIFAETIDEIGFDLCLLSSCNHSIHNHGTFGTWASVLAGGDVVVPTGLNRKNKTEVIESDLDNEKDEVIFKGWHYLGKSRSSKLDLSGSEKSFVQQNLHNSQG